MRLKNIERYSFEDVTGSYDFNVLKESLSQQTVEGLNKESAQWRKWKLIRNISTVGMCACCFIFLGNEFSSPIELFSKSYGPEVDKYLCILLASLSACMIAITETLYSAHKMAIVDSALLRRIRSNLQKFYYDSIVIKRLIINTPTQFSSRS